MKGTKEETEQNMASEIDELIGTNSFDKIFKYIMRDYYTYGFKCYGQFGKSNKKIDKDRNRIEKILGQNWEVKKTGKHGCYQIMVKTIQSDTVHSMQEIYSFHNLNYIGHFLNYLLDLDKEVILNEGENFIETNQNQLETVYRRNLSREELINVNEVDYAIIQNWFNEIRKGKHALRKLKVRINRQLDIFCSDGLEYKTLKKRMDILEEVGIVNNLSNISDVQRRTDWLKEQWFQYRGETRSFSSDTDNKGRDYWIKSDLTMTSFIKKGNELWQEYKDKSEGDFVCHLQRCCSFFSQYYVLERVGKILIERIGKFEDGMFQFKHHYIQKTLYDYHLLDILTAIEKNCVCLVEYLHGINQHKMEAVIRPLQIRISVTNGREYVMYYDIERNRISALRLEFIEKIISYENYEYVEFIKKEKKRNIKRNKIEKQMKLAYQMLPKIWGTELRECIVDKNWEKRLKTYEIYLDYDKQTEGFIDSRIKRESRQKNVEQKEKKIAIMCFPTKELRTWIRSFYMRMKEVKEIEEGDFSVQDDVDDLWNLYFGRKELEFLKPLEKQNGTIQNRKEYKIKGDEVSEYEGHTALFHECFSKYGVVLANSVLMCSEAKIGDTVWLNEDRREYWNFEEILKEEISKNFSFYTKEEKEYVGEILKSYVYEAGVIGKDKVPRFLTEKKDYLQELLPLTKLEVRWLFTVLNDSMAEIFLPKEMRKELCSYLKESVLYDVMPLPLEYVCYFDRYHLEERTEKEIKYIRQVYNAINSEKKLFIVFRNWNGVEKKRVLRPVWLEYSIKEDRMRVWGLDKYDKLCIVNTSRVERLKILENDKFDLDDTRKIVRNLYQKTMKKIRVIFYEGTKNLPDRILTEFSLWKKECIFDSKTELYTMTLYYSSYDEKEILIRLLSYGAYIKISSEEDDNYVCEELKRRVKLQRDKFQIRDLER